MPSLAQRTKTLILLGIAIGLLCLLPYARPLRAITPFVSPPPMPQGTGTLSIPIKVFLRGPYNPTTHLMNDTLRTQNLLPTTEPYSALPRFTHIGGETVNTGVFTVTGNDARVDWVQRDGDVVDMDGMAPVRFAN